MKQGEEKAKGFSSFLCLRGLRASGPEPWPMALAAAMADFMAAGSFMRSSAHTPRPRPGLPLPLQPRVSHLAEVRCLGTLDVR